MRESIFQHEWLKSWRHHFPECHIVKIPDMPRSAEARFIPAKPYDFYAILRGRVYAMELKLKTDMGAFPFKAVTDWQVNNLKEAKNNGALAFIVVNYRISKMSEKAKRKYGLDKGRIDIAFCLETDVFVQLDMALDSKSIPFQKIMEKAVSVEKRGGIWDIPNFVEVATFWAKS